MLHKIQECCLQCFNCKTKKKDYDYKKNEEKTHENKEQFEKLLEEIVIINEKKNVNNNETEEEIEYVLC